MRQLNPGRGRSAKTGRDDFPVVAVENVGQLDAAQPDEFATCPRVRCWSFEKKNPSGLANYLDGGWHEKGMAGMPRPLRDRIPKDVGLVIFTRGFLRVLEGLRGRA